VCRLKDDVGLRRCHVVFSTPAFLHLSTTLRYQDAMKSWNEAEPLIAPSQRRPAGDGGGRVRIRALGLTFATCMAIFGFDALFPGVKNWTPPAWRGPVVSEKPFEWSEVGFFLSHVANSGLECPGAAHPVQLYRDFGLED
jgi:hypothetical protein